MYLSIIIPCFNEEERLGKTLTAIDAYMRLQKYTYEIIVVDNGSTDGTVALTKEYQQKISHLSYIEKKSHGKGWAVKQGMLAATGDYRLFTDADNSTEISQVEKLLAFVPEYDVVISSRRIEGAVLTVPQSGLRVLLGNVFAGFVRFVVPLGDIKDTQNGFKLFSKAVTEKIFAHQTSYYWGFDVEILALARIFGFKIKEVPIVWVNDERTKMNLKGMVRTIFEIILVRFNLLTYDFEKLKRSVGRK